MDYGVNESKYMDLESWLEVMAELDIEQEVSFPSMVASMRAVAAIDQAAFEYRKVKPDENSLAQQIAFGDISTTQAIIDAANRTAMLVDEVHRDRAFEMMSRAADLHKGAALRAFKNSDLLGAIEPRFEATVASIRRLVDEIPEGITTDAHAVKFGVAQQFAELRAAVIDWQNILNLLRALIDERMIASSEHYATDLMIVDLDAYVEAGGRTSVMPRQARAILSAGPRLGVPSAPRGHSAQVSDEVAGRANREASKREATALAELEHNHIGKREVNQAGRFKPWSRRGGGGPSPPPR